MTVIYFNFFFTKLTETSHGVCFRDLQDKNVNLKLNQHLHSSNIHHNSKMTIYMCLAYKNTIQNKFQ
jgi:hypothetical protein